MKIINFAILTIIILSSSTLSISFSERYIRYNPERAYSGQSIWDVANIPEEKIDIGLWALIIAKEYDGSVNIEYYLEQLDSMTSEINRMIAGRPEDICKFLMTRMFICDSGIWNNNYPYLYDLDDPLGKKYGSKLFSTLIETHQGNCVTLPTLFLALMERIDPNIPFHAVKSPNHFFCRFYDRQENKIWNVESTRSGVANRDAWYIESQKIDQIAMDSCLYLCDLSKKEFISDLICMLARKHRHNEEYDKAIEYANLALELDSRSTSALVQKGALLAWKGYGLLEDIKSQNRQPTAEEHEKLVLYEEESIYYINRAKSMGWKPWSQEDQDRYLKFVEETKKMLSQ